MAEESLSPRKRVQQIYRILRRHAFLSNFYHQTHPEEILATFQELGPTFIKFGQLLSTRPDLISPAYIKALQTLQNDVPANDYEAIAKVYEESTGKTIAESFATFEKTPFASASVGQCHHATLHDGTPVVVKIQHPEVQQLITVDLALFERAVRLFKYLPAETSVVNFEQVFQQLRSSLLSEVDAMQEATNGETFYELNNHDGIIRVPKVYRQYCSAKVLVNEVMSGKSIKHLVTQPVPTDPATAQALAKTKTALAEVLVQNFIKQVFVDNFFHADPHPGNILYYETPVATEQVDEKQHQVGPIDVTTTRVKPAIPYNLVYLDFGMMGRLTPTLADDIAQVVLALAQKDATAVSQAVLNVCNATGEVDEAQFKRQLSRFVHPYLRAKIDEIDMPQFLFAMTQLCAQNHLQLKPEVTLLFKAFGTLEGLIAKLDPDLSLMAIATPFAKQYFKNHFNLRQELQDSLWLTGQSLRALNRLPQRAERILTQIEDGESRVNLHYLGQKQVLAKLNQMLNRLLIVIMLAALILSSSILVVGSRGQIIYRLGVIGWVVAIIITLLLIIVNLSRAYWRWRQRWAYSFKFSSDNGKLKLGPRKIVVF